MAPQKKATNLPFHATQQSRSPQPRASASAASSGNFAHPRTRLRRYPHQRRRYRAGRCAREDPTAQALAGSVRGASVRRHEETRDDVRHNPVEIMRPFLRWLRTFQENPVPQHPEVLHSRQQAVAPHGDRGAPARRGHPGGQRERMPRVGKDLGIATRLLRIRLTSSISTTSSLRVFSTIAILCPQLHSYTQIPSPAHGSYARKLFLRLSRGPPHGRVFGKGSPRASRRPLSRALASHRSGIHLAAFAPRLEHLYLVGGFSDGDILKLAQDLTALRTIGVEASPPLRRLFLRVVDADEAFWDDPDMLELEHRLAGMAAP
ncbi:hypothetical protein BDK51DRAFT_38206 [Blyttiomyces helicus]|uniref:Uncharacterized protein n=1 Tax=Blyttiomyces helicus TaxID=388810 RepID=A0A4P9WBA1_9FUNG|nr:hypothetical protein BDK51DRAFT_38206 [Blyttiomyces helicus]|eukprot:RKO87556.1 hypothetical protein BDK51DRAFT_38206 [Blyttiomyces helicus]